MAQQVEGAEDLAVLGIAWEADTALDLARRLQPDVIVVDAALRGAGDRPIIAVILRERPTAVVLVGADEAETRAAVRGLGLRAAELIQKPTHRIPGARHQMGRELIEAIRRAALRGQQLGSPTELDPAPRDSAPPSASLPTEHPGATEPEPSAAPRRIETSPMPARRLVVVGTSTGGPAALRVVLPKLRAPLEAGLIIIQHMPQTFTRSLARRLDAECQFPVHEAEDGEPILRNVALMAPGDYHLAVTSDAHVRLHREPPVHGVRPSLDLTLESAARAFGKHLLAVILTGMGVDGARGATVVKTLGGAVFAEHPSTSVVYGMPRAVVDQGRADQVVPLH
jgi:two-component system chemotaxis response regulator CheB